MSRAEIIEERGEAKALPRPFRFAIHAILTTFSAFAPLLAAAALYMALPFILHAAGFDLPPLEKALPMWWLLSVFGLLIIGYLALVLHLPKGVIACLRNGEPLLRVLPARLVRDDALPARVAKLLVVTTLLVTVQTAALGVKMNITAINPFSWDVTFMHLDRLIHGGTDPWRLLHPLLGHEAITRFIDFLYQRIWFVMLVGSWFAFGLTRGISLPQVRYMVAFMIAWFVGGNIMATVFSSAGPVFFAHLGHDAQVYGPLTDYLAALNDEAPLMSVDMSRRLWQGYVEGRNGLGGISAFPSMHNALAFLFALLAWQYGRVAGFVATAFAILILLGSVHLGWHYAVDAYAGVLIALLSWRLALPIARVILSRPAARELMRLTAKGA